LIDSPRDTPQRMAYPRCSRMARLCLVFVLAAACPCTAPGLRHRAQPEPSTHRVDDRDDPPQPPAQPPASRKKLTSYVRVVRSHAYGGERGARQSDYRACYTTGLTLLLRACHGR
jgi:hypothetical protein